MSSVLATAGSSSTIRTRGLRRNATTRSVVLSSYSVLNPFAYEMVVKMKVGQYLTFNHLSNCCEGRRGGVNNRRKFNILFDATQLPELPPSRDRRLSTHEI